MDYKNNSNTGLIIVADCMLLSVEYIGNVHLFFNITTLRATCTERSLEQRTINRLYTNRLDDRRAKKRLQSCCIKPKVSPVRWRWRNPA